MNQSSAFGCTILFTLLAAACAPAGRATGPEPARAPEYVPLTAGLPPIPRVEAAPAIRVIHPVPNAARPRLDSTFIYGSVGTGGALLRINGQPVPVAPNGAFIAYLPVPETGWELVAERNGQQATHTIPFRAPAAAAQGDSARPAAPRRAGTVAEGALAAPRAATVTGGADTLATGSDAVYARATPTGTYRWFFPRGARLNIAERRAGQYRVLLDSATSAWIDTTAVRPGAEGAAASTPATANARVSAAAHGATLEIAAGFAPFLVELDGQQAHVTVYGVRPGTLNAPAGGFVQGATQQSTAAGTQRFTLQLARTPWGYRAFYRPDGTLAVQVRQPPAIDAVNPLRGVRIVIDPGHPPAGATGPTGLYEGDANLAISLPLAEKLRARGAQVTLTRSTREPVASMNASEDLRARVALAVRQNADVLVSVHNNAFGEAANPFRAHGTSTYYFHPGSADLARALDREIVAVTRLPDLGARQGNLALVRPTWMPTTLTESLFMPIPEQENALRDPGFVERLAEAHVRGIEAFLRGRAGAGAGSGTASGAAANP